ncbi:hypothetical protein K438DRAFT_1772423 [Mycena galopus ATCC 62051]|nr:hypothetical protein K438DRAFT_1772423 [Mycena galopus ATCC 62051]
MTDLAYIVLIVCLLASNVGRLWRLFSWLQNLLFRPVVPQLIPYFDGQGNLIGLVRVPPGFNQRNVRVPAPISAEDRALNRDVIISSAQTSAEYLRADLYETESQPRGGA